MKHYNKISYKNVLLRPLCEDDIEDLRMWRNDPSNSQYLSKLHFITEEMQKQWYQKYLENQDEMIFAIVETESIKRIVGSLSLYQFSSEECLFGKILVGDTYAHGKKVGENATIAATQIAFEKLGLAKVKLYVYSENAAAVKIYKRAGFKIIDIHKDTNGKDEYVMIISNDEQNIK